MPTASLRVEVELHGAVVARATVPAGTDSTAYRLTWKLGSVTTIASTQGEPVRFRFTFLNDSVSRDDVCSLYSFWVSASESGESGGYLSAGSPEYHGFIDVST